MVKWTQPPCENQRRRVSHSDTIAAGGAPHRTNQWSLLADEVWCEMTNWDTTFLACTDTRDIKPPTCQETPLMCARATGTHSLRRQHLLCGACHPRPHPVIPSVTPTFMLCSTHSHTPLGSTRNQTMQTVKPAWCQNSSACGVGCINNCECGYLTHHLFTLSSYLKWRVRGWSDLLQHGSGPMGVDGSLGFLALI